MSELIDRGLLLRAVERHFSENHEHLDYDPECIAAVRLDKLYALIEAQPGDPDMDTAYEAGVEDGTAFANLHAKVYHDCDHRDAAPSPALTRETLEPWWGRYEAIVENPSLDAFDTLVGDLLVFLSGTPPPPPSSTREEQ